MQQGQQRRPSRVTRLKLSTNPAITRYGRDTARLVSTATEPSEVAEKKITGNTGSMQGEMPVTRPPIRPINASDTMIIIRHRSRPGLVPALMPPIGQPVDGLPYRATCRYYWLGGTSTVSIMYTVALAVCTPPHTKPAPLTLRSLP